MQQIVVATGNQGKLREIAAALTDFPYTLSPQSDFALSEAVEDGHSFVENALIKARHAARATGLPALADDSGLMLDALAGAPGIYSARYAGKDTPHAEKIQQLLAAWANAPQPLPGAQFYCALVFLRHAEDPAPVIAEGIWRGEVTQDLRGDQGFGYDPMFYLPDLACTAAELAIGEKNRISHRGQALQSLVLKLQQSAWPLAVAK